MSEYKKNANTKFWTGLGAGALAGAAAVALRNPAMAKRGLAAASTVSRFAKTAAPQLATTAKRFGASALRPGKLNVALRSAVGGIKKAGVAGLRAVKRPGMS